MIEIVIWRPPSETYDLERSLMRLTIGKDYLPLDKREKIRFNVVMGVSDEIINWNESTVSKQECIDNFQKLSELVSWAGEVDFKTSETILGCSSMRRLSSYSDASYYIWLDTDIIFDPITIAHSINSIDVIESTGITKFVCTPEIVRQWDSTWDCLVNEKFINKPVGYQATNNPYNDSFNEMHPILEEVRNTVPGQPYMKFGGGWFVLLSKEFLKTIPFPTDYGHYGLEDTYLMWGAQILNNRDIKQYKMKYVIICENYFDRIVTYKDKLKLIDRRDEFKKYNELLFHKGLQKLINNR